MDNQCDKKKIIMPSAPYVIRDTVDPFLSHADNRVYDSKSQYEKSIKSLGFEIIGNEKIPEKEFEIDDKKLKASFLLACAEHGLIDISQLPQKDILEYFTD